MIDLPLDKLRMLPVAEEEQRQALRLARQAQSRKLAARRAGEPVVELENIGPTRFELYGEEQTYLPSERRIRAECARIQRSWSPGERRKRIVGASFRRQRPETPVVDPVQFETRLAE